MRRGLIDLILRRGTVLYTRSRTLSSGEPHYLIVLNNRPYDGTGVVISVVTSQIEKRREHIARMGFPDTTLVLLPKGCYPHFDKDSAVDCNNLKVIPLDELRLCAAGEFKSPDFPEVYLGGIIQGALDSPKIPGELKALLKDASA